MRHLLLSAVLSLVTFSSFATETSPELKTAESSITDIYQSVLDVHTPITFVSHDIKKSALPGYDDPELKNKTFLVISRFTIDNKLQQATVGVYCRKAGLCEAIYTQPGV